MWLAAKDGAYLRRDFRMHLLALLSEYECGEMSEGKTLGARIDSRLYYGLTASLLAAFAIAFTASGQLGIYFSLFTTMIFYLSISKWPGLVGATWSVTEEGVLSVRSLAMSRCINLSEIKQIIIGIRSSSFEIIIQTKNSRVSLYDPKVSNVMDLYCAINRQNKNVEVLCKHRPPWHVRAKTTEVN